MSVDADWERGCDEITALRAEVQRLRALVTTSMCAMMQATTPGGRMDIAREAITATDASDAPRVYPVDPEEPLAFGKPGVFYMRSSDFALALPQIVKL